MKHAKAESAARTERASQDSPQKRLSGTLSVARDEPHAPASKASKPDKMQDKSVAPQDADKLLKADHRAVEKLFEAYEHADDTQKSDLARQICSELIVHTKIEEEIFYPACRAAGVEHSDLDEAQVEHDGAKVLIADVMHGSPGDTFFDAKVKVLAEYIKHHVGEEEKPRSGIFAQAKKAGVDLAALGERLQSRKDQLTAQKETLSNSPLEAHSLHLQDIHTTQENAQMPRNTQNNRGSQGRFMQDDTYNTGGRGYSSRGQYSPQNAGGQTYDRDHDDQGHESQRGGYGRSSSGEQGRGSAPYYGDNDRGRDLDHHRYSYATNEDYPYSGEDRSRDGRGAPARYQDWEQDRSSGRSAMGRDHMGQGAMDRNYESHSSARYSPDEEHDYSGSFRTNQGRGGQYDRDAQYSQSNYGQNRGQGGYSGGNSSRQYSQGNDSQGRNQGYGRNDHGHTGAGPSSQDRYGHGGSEQYGEQGDYGARSGGFRQNPQQNQSGYQGRGQQTSQNRYNEEDHDSSYRGSSARRDHGADSDRFSDDDRFTRSTRRNPQYRD